MLTHNLCCHGERRTKYTYIPVPHLSFDETKSILAVVSLFFCGNAFPASCAKKYVVVNIKFTIYYIS